MRSNYEIGDKAPWFTPTRSPAPPGVLRKLRTGSPPDLLGQRPVDPNPRLEKKAVERFDSKSGARSEFCMDDRRDQQRAPPGTSFENVIGTLLRWSVEVRQEIDKDVRIDRRQSRWPRSSRTHVPI
jgi:hypothetical protein